MSWFNIWSAWCLHMALWSLKPYVVLMLVTFNEASWFPCSPLSQNGLGESTHNCFHSVSKNFVKLKMVIVVHTYICLHYMCIYTVNVLCLYMSYIWWLQYPILCEITPWSTWKIKLKNKLPLVQKERKSLHVSDIPIVHKNIYYEEVIHGCQIFALKLLFSYSTIFWSPLSLISYIN